MKYAPVGELKDVVPDPVDDIPTFEELGETKVRSSSSDNGQLGKPVTELPLDCRIASVRNYASKIGEVSEGHRHKKTYCVAAAAVKDNALPRNVAEELVREFNDNHCNPPLDDSVIRNQVESAATYGKHAVRRIPEEQKRSTIEFVAPELPLESATMPAAPGDDELREIYRGTAWGTWMDEIQKVSADINPMYSITGSLTLQSVRMTPCVLVRGRKPNAYGMLVGHPSRGKGTNTTALEDVLGIMQRDLIDISSTKSLLKRGIGPNPWGCQIINGETSANGSFWGGAGN